MMLRSAILVALTAAATTTYAADSPQVKRGKHLVDTHDCNACHTPFKMGPNGPEPDMSLMLSGHPEKLVMPPLPKLEAPWVWVGGRHQYGVRRPMGRELRHQPHAPTPKRASASGASRTSSQAIKTGKHLGVGRPIMPPMPWPAYRNLSDADLKAMFAFLKTVPPIKNRVPDSAPPK